jgi:undecaprenyl diphosphate synthase
LEEMLVHNGKLPGELTKEELIAKLDPQRMPGHVAIIMDGNGRWANGRGLPRVAGHKKGMDAVRTAVTACSRLGIKALTLYAFSLENWRRPRKEVDALMSILTIYLQKELALMMENNIRFVTIGRTEDLPRAARDWTDKVKAETAGNTGMVLNMALSYGGRWEITEAARKLVREALSGKTAPDEVTEEAFAARLDSAGLPELDLMIRTSGEMRISNFLLWDMAYAELYFTEALWPDFGERDLLLAFNDYQGRQRRFGRTGEQLGREDAL